jgi:hypothetical protein
MNIKELLQQAATECNLDVIFSQYAQTILKKFINGIKSTQEIKTEDFILYYKPFPAVLPFSFTQLQVLNKFFEIINAKREKKYLDHDELAKFAERLNKKSEITLNRLEIRDDALVGYCFIEGKEREAFQFQFRDVGNIVHEVVQFNQMTKEFLEDFVALLNRSFK